MAKMFYSLEETAAKLGVSEDEIKQMANAGKLQQFRDRDNLMFKREQVDAMGQSADSGEISMSDTGEMEAGSGASQTGEIPLAGMDETGEIASPTGAGDTGEIGLAGDSTAGGDSGETGEIKLSDSGDTGVLESTGEVPISDDTDEAGGAGDTLQADAISPGDSGSGEYGLADSAAGSDVVSIESGDSGLDGSGMGGSVLGGSGLRGSELGSGDELGGIGSGMGSSGLLSGLGSGLGSSGQLGNEEDTGLSGEGDGTGLIDLAEDPNSGRNGGDAKQASGISVFDADEGDDTDPMAQTIMAEGVGSGGGMQGVGAGGDDDLSLESVGSGSGLLDLTREADDTSLGAELLDEIYPGETTADTKMDSGAGTSSGVFDGSVTLEAKDASGVELPEAVESEPEEAEQPAMEGEPAPRPVTYAPAAEAFDPAGSGMSTGMLLIATTVLVVGMIVAIFAIGGIPSTITTTLAEKQQTLYIAAGAAAGAAIVFGLVGMMIGKVLGR